MLAAGITIGTFKWTGDFTTINLIAATTNALNGALLARRPDHYKNFTVVGVLLMALLGGIGGGVTRDLLLNQTPHAFVDPAYILLCLGAGIVGYRIAFAKGELFREGLFQFAISFSLPWYAIAGAQAAEKAHLPVLGVLAIAVIGATAGRYYIDITCDVPPKQFIRGEWWVTIAALTGAVWLICDAVKLDAWWSVGISFVFGFTVRVLALYRGWEEPLAKEPTGVYQHSDGRPLLGRKLAGKSERELKDLGLAVEKPTARTDG
jgi:uncharacterized membrane protein YeiH